MVEGCESVFCKRKVLSFTTKKISMLTAIIYFLQLERVPLTAKIVRGTFFECIFNLWSNGSFQLILSYKPENILIVQ